MERVFGKFGKVQTIWITQEGSATVIFDSVIACYLAIKILNNVELPAFNAKLKVGWDKITISSEPVHDGKSDQAS